jgi:hypothetical protein
VRVDLSGHPASVIGSNVAGTRLEVVVPSGCDLGLLDVTVHNADGQFAEAPGLLVCEVPRAVALLGLVPRDVRLLTSGVQAFTAYLDTPASNTGLSLSISTFGAIAFAPAKVEVAPGASAARFVVELGDQAGFGEVHVAISGATEEFPLVAHVELVAPDDPDAPPPDPPVEPTVPGSVDLSGWQLRQTQSSRSFVFPPGTRIDPGGVIIVCRSASQTALESFFGTTFADWVAVLSGAGNFPTLNGDETLALPDAAGLLVDGPSIALPPGGGMVFDRRAPGLASDPGIWSASAAPRTDATPGRATQDVPAGLGPFLSEICDDAGSGNYVYEYVEVSYGR